MLGFTSNSLEKFICWAVKGSENIQTRRSLFQAKPGWLESVTRVVVITEVTKSQRNRRQQRRLQIFPKKFYVRGLQISCKVVDLLAQKLLNDMTLNSVSSDELVSTYQTKL